MSNNEIAQFISELNVRSVAYQAAVSDIVHLLDTNRDARQDLAHLVVRAQRGPNAEYAKAVVNLSLTVRELL